MIVRQILENGIGGFFNSVRNASTNLLNQGFSVIRQLFASLTGHVDALVAQIRTWVEGNKVAAIAIAAVGAITIPIIMPLVWGPAKAVAHVIGSAVAAVIKIPGRLIGRLFKWINARTTMS